MSIKTTHSVTREFAIEAIMKKIEEGELTDNQISNLLEESIHNGFYNFMIVDDLDGENWILDDLDNLPEYNDAF